MELIRLNLLGRFEARLPSGEVSSLPTRKSEALLAYLVLAPDKPHSRERLTGLLWSERSTEQARNSLRHALSALKKAVDGIDPSPLRVERASVTVSSQSIEVDALELQRLTRQKDPGALVQASVLYRGEFLEGMVIKDPACEEWLSTERDRYRRMAVDTLANLLEHYREMGDSDAAINTGERLVGLDPLRESAWRELMQAYADGGERNQALNVYKRCGQVLANELGVEPEVQTTELDAAIRDGAINTKPSIPQPDSSKAFATQNSEASSTISPIGSLDKPSIAVLPFENLSGDPEQEYFAEGMTHTIATELSRIRSLIVKPVLCYEGDEVSGQHVAENMGVRYLLKGSVQKQGDRVRVTAELVDAETGVNKWSERFDRSGENILDIQDEIAQGIVATIWGYKGRLQAVDFERTIHKATRDFNAYDFVLRGITYKDQYSKEDNIKAHTCFSKAYELDPDYADASAWLAWGHIMDVSMGWSKDRADSLKQAFDAANRAVELDRYSDFVFSTLAAVYLANGQHDRALATFDRALELNPNNADIMVLRAEALYTSGKADDAIICVKKAMRLNPYYPEWYLWTLGAAYYVARRYDDAVKTLNQMTNHNLDSQLYLAASYAQLGQTKEAELETRRILDIDSEFVLQKLNHGNKYKTVDYFEHLLDGLRKAGLPEQVSMESGQLPADSAPELPDKPSIAVMPFTNLSGDSEQEYFSDGITEDIITALSRISGLLIVARHSTMVYKDKTVDLKQVGKEQGVRYVLEGSVRKSGNRIRVSTQLIDAPTGHHLWAEHYDRDLEDIFEVQDEITKNVTTELNVRLARGEEARVWASGTSNIEAWEKVVRAVPLSDDHIKEHNVEAQRLASEAVHLDPTYVTAWVNLGWTHWEDALWDWGESHDSSLKMAQSCAQRALKIESEHPEALALLGSIYMSNKNAKKAIELCKKAVELSPSDASNVAIAAMTLIFSGQPKTGLPLINRAMRLSPIYPAWYKMMVGAVHHITGDHDNAIAIFRKSLAMEPETTVSRIWLASALIETEEREEASVVASEILEIDPDFTVSNWVNRFSADDNLTELLVTNLVGAGLPE